MSQSYKDWLKLNPIRDENRIPSEKRIEEIRAEVEKVIFDYFKENEDQCWCDCDTCVLIRIKAVNPEVMDRLALAGLQFLLGETFNGIAAGYYYSFKKNVQTDDAKRPELCKRIDV